MKLFLGIVIALFVFATTALAETPDPAALKAANSAFARVAKMAQGSAQLRVTTESTDRLSRQRAVSNGSPTPEKPEVGMWPNGVDEDNNARFGVDVVAQFKPVNPLRIFVNGYRTQSDGVFQTTIGTTPSSPYGLVGQGIAELHGLQVVIPGKLGMYQLEAQIDWSKEHYFSSVLKYTVDHMGAIAQMCVSPNGDVNIVFVLNTFDKTFPKTMEVRMNDILLISRRPVTVKKEAFLVFVTMTLSGEDYLLLSATSQRRGGASFMLRGDNGVTINWNDYLPLFRHLGSCEGSCYSPETGEPQPCN